MAESTVLYLLKKNGIRRRDPAEHNRKVTEEMVDEWVVRYLTGRSLKQIAGDLVGPATVWNHLKARGVVLRDRVEAQIQAVTKYQRNPFTGDKIQKAYLMGLRYGDLNAVGHGRSVRVRVSTTHPEMALLFQNLFSPYGHVAWYPQEAKLTGYEWTLECDLDRSFRFLLEKPGLPQLGLTDAEFYAFLAGIIDAEGSIVLHKKAYAALFEISISNTDVNLLTFIQRRLEKLGYHPYRERKLQDELRLGYFRGGEISVIRLANQTEVCRLLESLTLRHGEKMRKGEFVTRRVCSDQAGAARDEEEDWRVLGAEIERDVHDFIDLAESAFTKKKGRRNESLLSTSRSRAGISGLGMGKSPAA